MNRPEFLRRLEHRAEAAAGFARAVVIGVIGVIGVALLVHWSVS